jgi:hypothetical protein
MYAETYTCLLHPRVETYYYLQQVGVLQRGRVRRRA